jgi:hypothetical protein
VKLALHRSITFWSGLLVIGFVCWAWWYSLAHFSYVARWNHAAWSFSGEVTVLYQGGQLTATLAAAPKKKKLSRLSSRHRVSSEGAISPVSMILSRILTMILQ